MVRQCTRDDDYPTAVALFVLAGMDTCFDVSRVADKTVADTSTVLLMTFQSRSPAEEKKFDTAIHTVSADKSVNEDLCGWVQQIGPPTYYPKYMIMHGMNAVVAGLTKKPLQEELLPVPDASEKWRTIGESFLHCAPREGASRSAAETADQDSRTIRRAIADATDRTPSGGRVFDKFPFIIG